MKSKIILLLLLNYRCPLAPVGSGLINTIAKPESNEEAKITFIKTNKIIFSNSFRIISSKNFGDVTSKVFFDEKDTYYKIYYDLNSSNRNGALTLKSFDHGGLFSLPLAFEMWKLYLHTITPNVNWIIDHNNNLIGYTTQKGEPGLTSLVNDGCAYSNNIFCEPEACREKTFKKFYEKLLDFLYKADCVYIDFGPANVVKINNEYKLIDFESLIMAKDFALKYQEIRDFWFEETMAMPLHYKHFILEIIIAKYLDEKTLIHCRTLIKNNEISRHPNLKPQD